jgi:superfamily II DNA or RNA helicase
MEEVNLFEWQKAGAQALLESLRKNNVALDASDTGTGKTAKAVWLAQQLNADVIVVCPKAVIPAWREWLDRGGITHDVINYEKLKTGKTKLGKWNEAKSWEWTFSGAKLLIFDEVHRCKGATSVNAKILTGSKKYTTLMLSATAAENPLDMRATGYMLGLHEYHDFYRWAHHMGCRKAPWGRGLAFMGGKKMLREIHQKVFPQVGHRIRIADLGDAFPSNSIFAECYDMGDVDVIYEKMQAQISELKAKRSSENPLTIKLRARQEAELMRVPVFVELTEQALSEGNAVVAFFNFRQSLDAYRNLIGTESSEIIGDQKDDTRLQNINDFQENKVKVCACMIQAGGVGLSLHDLHGVPRVSLIAPTYSAIDTKQALGRIHRAGALSPSRQYLLFANGTVETQVARSLRRKLRNIETITDGDTLGAIL